MLTAAGWITKGPTDRRSAPAEWLNGRTSALAELSKRQSGGFDTGERPALLLGAREVSYFALDSGRMGRQSGKCRITPI